MMMVVVTVGDDDGDEGDDGDDGDDYGDDGVDGGHCWWWCCFSYPNQTGWLLAKWDTVQ